MKVLTIVQHQSFLLRSALQKIINIALFTKNREAIEMQRRHVFFRKLIILANRNESVRTTKK